MSIVEKNVIENNEEIKNNEETENIYNEITNWDELDIHTDILRGIYAFGLEKPSPIQCKTIVPIINKKDIIAQAQSGTGKTAAFTIGALSRINLNKNSTQILVLSPTRELSIQTANVMKNIGELMKGLCIQILVGGTSVDDDVCQLKKIHHIL